MKKFMPISIVVLTFFFLLNSIAISSPKDSNLADVYISDSKIPIQMTIKGLGTSSGYLSEWRFVESPVDGAPIFKVRNYQLQSITFIDNEPIKYSGGEYYLKVESISKESGEKKIWYLDCSNKQSLWGYANKGGFESQTNIKLNKIKKIVFRGQ